MRFRNPLDRRVREVERDEDRFCVGEGGCGKRRPNEAFGVIGKRLRRGFGEGSQLP